MEVTINISVIGILVTVFLFFLAHVGTLVWFMSRINTVVMVLQRDLVALAKILEKFETERYTQRDAQKDWLHHKDEHRTLWSRIDELKDAVNQQPRATGGPK